MLQEPHHLIQPATKSCHSSFHTTLFTPHFPVYDVMDLFKWVHDLGIGILQVDSLVDNLLLVIFLLKASPPEKRFSTCLA